MNYQFTEDWDYVSNHTDIWTNHLKNYIDKPDVKMLEIGSLEGRSTIWFLENILTHGTSSITCVDHDFRENFYFNIHKFAKKVKIYSGETQIILRDKEFLQQKFDIIYIDGNHAASYVLEDAILAFPSLKIDGILIFDDYLWLEDFENKPLTEEEKLRQQPKMAIDAFFNIFQDSLVLLHLGYQVLLKKKENIHF